METNLENKKIEIEHETLKNLNTIRKWAMFLAIIGFISLGLVALIGIIAGTFLSAFNTGATGHTIPESIIFVLLIVMATLYFFPIHFLFRFSKHTAKAVSTFDKVELLKAFKNLKACFVFLGIFIIVILTLYAVTLVLAGASMSFLKGF